MDLMALLTKEDLKLGKELFFKKNTIICRENDICNSVYFVISGEVKISSYDKDGREDIYNNISDGGLFANSLIFNNTRRFLGNVIATKDTKLFIIEKNDLFTILQSNVIFLYNYISLISQDVIKLKQRLKMFAQKDIREKFLYYLKINNGKTSFSVQKLSEQLFVQRPSLSRIISDLNKEGLIKKEGKTITLLK